MTTPMLPIWAALDKRVGTVEFVKVPGHDPGNQFPLNTAADIVANYAAGQASAGLPAEDGVDHRSGELEASPDVIRQMVSATDRQRCCRDWRA